MPSYVFELAAQLLDPRGGDVVFVVCDETLSRQKLYASKQILTTNSEYFACSMAFRKESKLIYSGFKPEWNSKPAFLPEANRSSSSLNGDVERNILSPPTSSEPGFIIKDTISLGSNCDQWPLVIYMDDPADDIDFVTLHNILYYLYTNCVNLQLDSEEYPPIKESHPPGYPERPDPFELYKSAKKFLLTSLSDYCFNYLKGSLTAPNVSGRLFRQDCELRDHDELRDLYCEYLLTNYDKVKKTDGWRTVVSGKVEVDISVRIFHKELLLEITERLTYAPLATTSVG